jgi:hypothetical protein
MADKIKQPLTENSLFYNLFCVKIFFEAGSEIAQTEYRLGCGLEYLKSWVSIPDKGRDFSFFYSIQIAYPVDITDSFRMDGMAESCS